MITEYDHSKIKNYEELRKVQLMQLEIIKFLDEFCNKNNIKYSIVYGTLLGAVRHGGFIPWDDDLDICMLRKDYNRFLSLWKNTDNYLLQNNNTDSDFSQSFSKIRKKNTAFVQKNDLGRKYHKGIYVDIFPFDRVPKSKFKQKTQKFNAMLYQLFVRGYAPEKEGGLLNFGSKFLLKITPRQKYNNLIKKHLNKISQYSNNFKLKTVDFCVFKYMDKYYDCDLFDDLIRIKYENIEVFAFSKYDYFLKKVYGDYMQLPPEEQQTWYHHPVYVSFTNEYEEDKIEQ